MIKNDSFSLLAKFIKKQHFQFSSFRVFFPQMQFLACHKAANFCEFSKRSSHHTISLWQASRNLRRFFFLVQFLPYYQDRYKNNQT